MLLRASTTLHKGVKNTNNSYKLLLRINIMAYTNTIKDCDSHKGHVEHVREGNSQRNSFIKALSMHRPNVLMNVWVLSTLLSHMKLDYLELTVLAQSTNMYAIFGHIEETP